MAQTAQDILDRHNRIRMKDPVRFCLTCRKNRRFLKSTTDIHSSCEICGQWQAVPPEGKQVPCPTCHGHGKITRWVADHNEPTRYDIRGYEKEHGSYGNFISFVVTKRDHGESDWHRVSGIVHHNVPDAIMEIESLKKKQ